MAFVVSIPTTRPDEVPGNMSRVLRPLDREVFALAVPALGALAAEPLYVLVDTAIVGGFGLVLLALTDVLPHAFTGDERVVERAHQVWWLFAALMPLNGVVFALDGIPPVPATRAS